MNNSTVEKTLLKGTPKQRALLIANHLSEANLGGKGFLTDSELSALTNSFKTDAEIKIYRAFRRRHELVSAYLSNLSQARLSYKEVLERLEKFILLRMSNCDFEDALNTVLELIKDKKTRSKALSDLTFFNRVYLHRRVTVDKAAGLVSIKTDNIDTIIKQLRVRVKNEQVNLKTTIQALKDYLDETGFNVKVFKIFLKEVENWAKSAKGMTLTGMRHLLFGGSDPLTEDGVTDALRQLRKQDILEDEYDSVEIDKEVYDRLRRDELDA